MRKLRLTIAFATSLGLALGIAAAGWTPSSAQQAQAGCQASDSGGGPTGAVSSPADGHNLTSDPAREDVSGQFSESSSPLPGASNQIQVDITVLACADQVLPSGTSGSVTGPSSGTSFSWQTPALPWNGLYGISIKATGSNSGGSGHTVVRTFSVVVPPKTPTDVRAVGGNSGSVTLGWVRNAEPDMVGYVLQREGSETASFQVPQPTCTTCRVTFVDDSAAPGDWRYNVVAIRRGATADQGLNSTPSSEASATVTAPPSTTTPASSTTSQSGGDTSSSSGAGSTSTASTSAASSSGGKSAPIAKSGTVDLSNFAALLDANRKTTQAQADALADPGFKDKLPFKPGDAPVVGNANVAEAGAKAPNQGIGQKIVTDTGDRRRALAFVAGAALFFVMFLQVRLIKSEVDRSDLEPTAPGTDDEPEPEPEPEPAPVLQEVASVTASPLPAASEPAVTLSAIEMDPELSPPLIEVLGEPDHKPEQPIVIAPIAPTDAPHLDVPDPPARAPRTPTTRSTDAGRATRRVPPRPSNDRGQGRAPVRARRRGAGGGDRRVPLG